MSDLLSNFEMYALRFISLFDGGSPSPTVTEFLELIHTFEDFEDWTPLRYKHFFMNCRPCEYCHLTPEKCHLLQEYDGRMLYEIIGATFCNQHEPCDQDANFAILKLLHLETIAEIPFCISSYLFFHKFLQ